MTTDSTPPVDIPAALALCHEATPGPWRWQWQSPGGCRILWPHSPEDASRSVARVFCDIDAQFIAAARTLLPAALDELQAAREEIERLRADRDKLQAFKDWTHRYLDAHSVPHHPPGTHGAEGCRIGDRMDWLMQKLYEARMGSLLEVD